MTNHGSECQTMTVGFLILWFYNKHLGSFCAFRVSNFVTWRTRTVGLNDLTVDLVLYGVSRGQNSKRGKSFWGGNGWQCHCQHTNQEAVLRVITAMLLPWAWAWALSFNLGHATRPNFSTSSFYLHSVYTWKLLKNNNNNFYRILSPNNKILPLVTCDEDEGYEFINFLIGFSQLFKELVRTLFFILLVIRLLHTMDKFLNGIEKFTSL